MEKVTMSSDGQGSWSNYDAEGKLVEIGVSDVDTIYRQIVYMVKEENMDLEEKTHDGINPKPPYFTGWNGNTQGN